MMSGPFHCWRTHSTSFHVTEGSKLVWIHAWKSLSGARLPTMSSDRPAANADVPQPFGSNEQLAPAPQSAAGSAVIAIARAGDSEIDGEDQCTAPRLPGARDHVGDEAAVLDEVELVPRHVAGSGDLAQRAGADGGQREWDVGSGCGACSLNLAAAGVEAGQADGTKPDGHRPSIAEQLGRKIDRGDVAKHALLERDRSQILDVPAKRRLIARATVEIFEQEVRQPRLGERAIVGHGCRSSHSAPPAIANGFNRRFATTYSQLLQSQPSRRLKMAEPLRMDFTKVAPEAYRHLSALEQTIGPKVDKTLYHLLKVRASQINGCAFCIGMHTDEALRDGEKLERLMMLDAWDESSLFNDKERAVLKWVEEITHISKGHAPKEAFDSLKPHFSDEEIVWLTLASAMINTWNRIAISSRAQYDREAFHQRIAEVKVPEPA